jgi:FkbH-like protein
MSALYTELQWLPGMPQGFAQRMKALEDRDGDLGSEIQALATHALDLTQLKRLTNVILRARAKGKSLRPLTPFRLAVVSNSTIDMIVPALIASAARHGIALEIVQPAYDQVAQQALNPESQINRSNADAVLFALDYRALPIRPVPGNAEEAAEMIRGASGYLQRLRDGVRANSSALCILQTIAPPAETLFGHIDRTLSGTMRNVIDGINRHIGDLVYGSGDVLLDVAALAETVGLANWHDPRLWNMAKLPFSHELIPLYADHVGRLLAAIRGKSRKVLVLDLDNIVWGGVIGDDGVAGIRIAQGDAAGEAHLAVQRLALDLRQRGIVLAVSSKNTDHIAREPFEKHPEMLLKLGHIAVFQANWSDKATNIKAIAEQLSLGLDSFVLLDDNPVERQLVRSLLPQVAVPELPEEPALYARTLASAGYFESVTFEQEDLNRAAFYQSTAQLAELQNQVSGVDEYLASLDMTITFQPFDAVGRARITQLINKSNQFNLTTRRYTEPEIEQAERDPAVLTLQVRLADIFGDNGIISAIICRPAEAGTWDIDTWLMSCRMLGRKVETVVLRTIVDQARTAGVSRLTGTYEPTRRNELVAQHYAKLGFTKLSEDESGTTHWELLLDNAEMEIAPMKVIYHGFSDAPEELITR